MMDISQRKSGKVTILELSGWFTKGRGDVKFRQVTGQLISAKSTGLVVNMQGLKMMDSSGLGELVAAKRRAVQAGGDLKLLHVEDKVLGVLKMAGIDSVFEIFNNESTAVGSF